MNGLGNEYWADGGVLLKSFSEWIPDEWGTLGWTDEADRERVVRETSDPFVAVFTIILGGTERDPDLKGKIAGFYLVSHERGDRDDFTHPSRHHWSPPQWRYSLRALRAFTYLPERRLKLRDLNPAYPGYGRDIAKRGRFLTDSREIAMLRDTPWVEVDIYGESGLGLDRIDAVPQGGFVRAGPANEGGYLVSPEAQGLTRQLYVLKLEGDTDAYMGRECGDCSIYKIGLAVSPRFRCETFQKALPRGAFQWRVVRATTDEDFGGGVGFDAAVAGEYAMKMHLRRFWLNGEFYLAGGADIEEAWGVGCAAVKEFQRGA